MNWLLNKPLYDVWGSVEKDLYLRSDARALAVWQSLSISIPSEEFLQSLSGFCNKNVSEEMLCDFISHSWTALGQLLCSDQRDWLLDENRLNSNNLSAEMPLWNVLAQSARATLGLASDEALGKMICPGATAEQLLEMILPTPFFGDFVTTLERLRSEPLKELPPPVYHSTDFPWEELERVSNHVIEVTGVGMGISPHLLMKTLTEITQIVEGINKAVAGTSLSQMTLPTLNLLKPLSGPSPFGLHTGMTNTIDVYVSENSSVSVVDVFAHEWGHALESQVGHRNFTTFANPRLKNLQAPLEELVDAVLNTPQCPVAAQKVRQNFNEEMVHNLADRLNKSSRMSTAKAKQVARNLWERALHNQSLHYVLPDGRIENSHALEDYTKNLVGLFSEFNQQLADGKSAWISYSVASDRLANLHESHAGGREYWGNPNEIFARAIEVSLPDALGISPKTARYEMYPHDGEYSYICEQVKIFLASLAPVVNLSDKINKKRGSEMVTVKLGLVR